MRAGYFDLRTAVSHDRMFLPTASRHSDVDRMSKIQEKVQAQPSQGFVCQWGVKKLKGGTNSQADGGVKIFRRLYNV